MVAEETAAGLEIRWTTMLSNCGSRWTNEGVARLAHLAPTPR